MARVDTERFTVHSVLRDEWKCFSKYIISNHLMSVEHEVIDWCH